jgi:tyrosyl-tRNA synthetase
MINEFELIKKNTTEIVTEDEYNKLINEVEKPIAYAGYEPSGKIHLGHVLTVNKLIDLQKQGFEIIILLADLHAYLNKKGTLKEVKEIADYNKKCFIALGLSKDTRFIYGTDFQLNKEYSLKVLEFSLSTSLNRAKRSMDEVGRNMDKPMVSQMLYPIMQTVDIDMLKCNVAVGGIDQRKIHMLARELLPNPPICIHLPILLGLNGKKMSSSENNYISIDDSEEVVNKKLKKAFCPAGVVVDNPVLDLFKYFIFEKYDEVLFEIPEKYGGDLACKSYEELESLFLSNSIHAMDLKLSAAKYLNYMLEPIRDAIDY